MRQFEVDVAKILLEAAGLERLLPLLAASKHEVFEYTGHGYYLTITHADLPVERTVLDKPHVAGTTAGVEEVGFVAFVEEHEFLLECHGYAEGIPENFRERDVTVSTKQL